MKKLLTVLLLLGVISVYPQNNYKYPIPSYHLSGKYGYSDTSMKVLIAPRYKEVNFFYDGRAAVKEVNKYGYINTKGSMIIFAEWDYAGNFRDGIAVVGKKSGNSIMMYQYIDTTGKLITDTKYEKAEMFYEGAGVAMRSGKYYIVNKSGKEITEGYDEISFFREGLAQVKSGGKWGYINPKGEVVIAPQYDVVWNFYNGYAWVTNKNQTGLIDKTGKLVEEFIYRDEYPTTGLQYKIVYENGKSTVTRRDDSKQLFTASVKVTRYLQDDIFEYTDPDKNLFGVINSAGKIITQPLYKQFWPVTGKFIAGKRNEFWGLLDYTGKELLPFDNYSLNNSQAGPFFVTKKDAKLYCQYNPKTGKLSSRCLNALEFIFDNTPPEGFVFGYSNGTKLAVDREGRIYESNDFSYLAELSHDELSNISLNTRTGENKKLRIESYEGYPFTDFVYDSVGYTYDVIIVVKRDGKYGYFSKKGMKEVIPCVYDGADDFDWGLAPVKKGNKWGFINEEGKVMFDFKYDSATPFHGGDAVVTIDGKKFEMKTDGSMIEILPIGVPSDPWKPNPDFGENTLTQSLSIEYYYIMDSPYSKPGSNPSFSELDSPEVINFSANKVTSRYYSLTVQSSGVVNQGGKTSYIYNFEKTSGNTTYTQCIVQDNYNTAAFFTVHGGVVIYRR